ncbi:hypothetical protein T484DRAFT_1824449, partial [Baffinella frigidus]
MLGALRALGLWPQRATAGHSGRQRGCGRWRDAGEEWCSPASYSKEDLAATGVPEAHDLALDSKVVCHKLRQNKHSAFDNLCSLSNVVFNLGQLAEKDVTELAMKKYVESKHEKLPYVPWRKG